MMNNVNQYLQCFNVKTTDSKLEPGGSNYYCSEHPLPATISNLPALRGKICDMTNPASDCVP